MDFNELIAKRHSVRRYKNEPIPKEVLEKIVESAKLAPSSRNLKPCGFITVTDKALLEKFSQSKSSGSQFVKDAAAAIVVYGDSEKSDIWDVDSSIAVTYLHLAATNEGVGSCWIHLNKRTTKDEKASDQYVKKLLNLEEKYQVLALVALGYEE